MPKYVFAYHGKPDFQTKEEGMAHMTKWREWSASLGAAMVDPGMPVGMSKTVTANGIVENGGSNPLSGITIVQADSIDDALKMAARCPHVSGAGTIEVAEALDMEM